MAARGNDHGSPEERPGFWLLVMMVVVLAGLVASSVYFFVLS